MKATDHIQAEIRELGDEMVTLRARSEQIESEVQALAQERDTNASRREAIRADLDALRRALAALEEHQPTAVPVPTKAPDSRLRSELRALTARPASPIAPTPARIKQARAQRAARDPLTVVPRNVPEGKESPKADHGFTYDGDIELRERDMSSTVTERAQFALDIIKESDARAMSQHALAIEMGDLLQCKPTTAQTITSQCIRVLAYEGRITYTGQKVPTEPGGNHVSPVWKITETKD